MRINKGKKTKNMTNEEVFKNYGSEEWVIEDALCFAIQKYWQKCYDEGRVSVAHPPVNCVGFVKNYMKEETLCSVKYAEKSKMDTLQAEGNEIGCDECPKEIEEG